VFAGTGGVQIGNLAEIHIIRTDHDKRGVNLEIAIKTELALAFAAESIPVNPAKVLVEPAIVAETIDIAGRVYAGILTANIPLEGAGVAGRTFI
jgi:hypothetical protein